MSTESMSCRERIMAALQGQDVDRGTPTLGTGQIDYGWN